MGRTFLFSLYILERRKTIANTRYTSIVSVGNYSVGYSATAHSESLASIKQRKTRAIYEK